MDGVELESLTFSEIAGMLDALDERRMSAGWTLEDAALRAQLEDHLVVLAVGSADSDARRERDWAACRLPVVMWVKTVQVHARVISLGIDGAFVRTGRNVPVGSLVVIEVRGDSGERGSRVTGLVTAVRSQGEDGGLIVSFCDTDESAIRRRRVPFVLEALRRRE